MLRFALVFTLAALTSACLADDLASFWRPGNVRELLLGGGLDNKPASLADWAANGVNCVLGASPTDAHAAGLKARTWFTMDYMDDRSSKLPDIERMIARGEDGRMLRPFDPLFPEVGQHGYTACVNNPGWQQHSQEIFRKAAEAGFDGVHVDFATHYERCFCEHCRAAWDKYAPTVGLSLDLPAAEKASDVRTRMLLREFRIRCVIAFLNSCREAARAIKPGYSLDGTYHQDSGSTFQWQYGDHYDLMCIEGTTWGQFPPASEQIVWLKASAGLSRGKVPMSVTYHMIPNPGGGEHHGRMAADRLELALAEIMSQGAVSWLGLGGPSTGSLLREHQPLVKSVYRFFGDNEKLIAGARPLSQVALLFSPRSYLLDGAARSAAFIVGEALMKAHVPFQIIGDGNLTASDLARFQGVVVLPAPALSNAAIRSLNAYASAGGHILTLGQQAKYTEDWHNRSAGTAAFLSADSQAGGLTARDIGKGKVFAWGDAPFKTPAMGAAQYVALNQEKAAPVVIEGFSKALAVSGARGGEYSLYVDVTYQDGTPLWGQTATFDTGTHDWQFSRFVIKPEKPIRGVNVHLLFRGHGGTAWFRDVQFGQWDEPTGKITQNLLGSQLRPTDGKVYNAAPGEAAAKGEWGPYAEGFQVETIDGRPTVKCAAPNMLAPGEFYRTDQAAVREVMAAVDKLLDQQRSLVITAPAGADNVYGELTQAPGLVVLQLINYNAALHPDLPELEQQKTDRTIPVESLRASIRLPRGAKLRGAELRLIGGEKRRLTATREGGMVRIDLPRLDKYAMVVLTTE